MNLQTRVFSARRARTSYASLTSIPPYFAFQALQRRAAIRGVLRDQRRVWEEFLLRRSGRENGTEVTRKRGVFAVRPWAGQKSEGQR